MGVITLPTVFADNTVPTAAQFNGNFSAIATEVNGGLDNDNIDASAAIAYSKLSLTGGIVNADISASAAIARSKIAATVSCSLYKSSTQSISGSTLTSVTFNAEEWDTATMHDTGSNTSRIVVPTTGKYHLEAQVNFGTTEDKYIAFAKNGSVIMYGSRNTGTNHNISRIVDATAGDYFEVQAYTTAGGGATISAGAQETTFQAMKVSE